MRKNINTLSIFNYEGDAIWIEKTKESVKVYDQWSKLVDTTTAQGFMDFVEGKRDITDSAGKTWRWMNEPGDGRNSIQNIMEFLKLS